MKKKIRKKIENKSKDNNNARIIKYPYLLTSYNNSNYRKGFNLRKTRTNNKTINNTLSLYNPDEEYVTKLNFFDIASVRENKTKITLYNLNTITQFPALLKKNNDNAESFKEKKRILNELNNKMTMLDKKKSSESSKQTYVNRFENAFKENQLEKERKEIEKKIYKLKEMRKGLSTELSDTIKEIDNLKIDVEIMQNFRSYNLFNNNNVVKKPEVKIKEKEKDKNNISTNETESEKVGVRKSLLRSLNKEKERDSMADKERERENKFRMEMQLISTGEKVNKMRQKIRAKISELEDKKISLLEKIDICENELQKFKDIHNNIKDELLVHYHRLLAEGKDTRKEGLTWIILAIWKLKSNVLLSYLPKFLDKNIILFLFEYSSLLKTIKETEKKIQALAIKVKESKKNYQMALNKKIAEKENEINNNNINKGKEKEKEKEDDEYNEEEEENENEESDEENEYESENDESGVNEEDNNINEEDEEEEDNKKRKNRKKEEKDQNKEEKQKEEEENDRDDNILGGFQKKEEDKNNEYNQQTKFGETFKTSLYNTKSNSDNPDNYKKGNNLKEENISKKEKSGKKVEENIFSLPNNFQRSLFRKEDLYKGKNNMDYKQNKIRLKDFQNLFNKKQSVSVDYRTLELFNEHKKMEKYYMQLKEKAEKLMKNELDRVCKSFYLYDYGAKYNIDQKTVISALIGEDGARSEYNRQKKKEKDYFKTLSELRNGKMFQKK